MHYRVLAIVDGDGDLDEAVKEILERYHEDRWDWYQIGGRWSGTFDGYQPQKDPENLETCYLCNGTGERPDKIVENGCDGCSGTGQRIKWPTDWKRHAGDVTPVEQLTQEILDNFHAIVSTWGWYAKRRYMPWREPGERFVPQEMPPSDWLKEMHADCLAVVVDCHE